MRNEMPRKDIMRAYRDAQDSERYVRAKLEAAGNIEESLYRLEQLADVQEAILNIEEVLGITG